MKKKRDEDIYPYCVGLWTGLAYFIYVFCFDLGLPKTISSLFPALLNVSAIMIGFISTSLSIIFTQKDKPIMQQFAEVDRMKSIIDKSKHAILFFMFVCLISIICALISWDSPSFSDKFLFGLLILVFFTAGSSSYRIIDFYYIILKR